MSLHPSIKTSLISLLLIAGSSELLASEPSLAAKSLVNESLASNSSDFNQPDFNQPASSQPVSDNTSQTIYILHQANDIPLSTFVQRWPSLKKCIANIMPAESISESCIDKLLSTPAQGGALNLKSQIKRNKGLNQQALALISRAIKIEPEQHLHHFQLAINHYQQLRKATSGKQKWMLSMQTAKAYKRAFELDQTQFHYRYYIAYNYLLTPDAMGGSKQKALTLADNAIAQGYFAFHPVRADILNAMNDKQKALASYIDALETGQYKRSSFKKALLLAKNNPQLVQRINQFIQQAEAIIRDQI